MAQLRRIGKAAALTVAIAAGLGFVSAANANIVATSVLEVTNFLIKKGAGGASGILSAVPVTGDIGIGGVTDNGTNSASLTGFATVNNPGTLSGGGSLDILQACVGGPCPAENNFAHTVPPTASHLVRADSELFGTPIDGLPGPLGATAKTVAEVLLTGDGVGDGDSDLGLLTTFTFTLPAPTIFNLSFNAELYLRAFQSTDLQPNFQSSASATSKLTFTITNLFTGAQVFSWAPNGALSAAAGAIGGTELADGHNLNTTITAALPISPFNNIVRDVGVTSFAADTDLLPTEVEVAPGVFVDILYQFDISHVVGANGKQVPEPGTLLLIGAAIAGLGLTRRQKKVS